MPIILLLPTRNVKHPLLVQSGHPIKGYSS